MSNTKASYQLHTLGWNDFQNLCSTILRDILGQTFQQFAETADGGRDGAFYGKWVRQGAETMEGSFVLQCKFTAKSDALLQVSDVTDEIGKARRLARRGLCRNYILITNAGIRAPVEAELKSSFESIRGIEHFKVFDGNWVSQQIRENKRLRVLVPRVYGLGDLTEILDERIYEQAKEVLSWLGDELARFVVTDAHHRSVHALQDRRFVFLLGDAGTGKSTIAASLALAAADHWQSRVIKITDPNDFKQHSNPNEKHQFFWVDDVFGQLRYERERATKWNHLLPSLAAAIHRGAVAIFTSRRYIYQDALEDLKESAFPLLKESQVVIEVEKLSDREREQILYNHLRLGNQTQAFRSALKPFLSEVARSSHFLPELARRLGHTSFTKRVRPHQESVMHFLEHPEEYLNEQFEKFGERNRAAMALVFMKNGSLRAPLNDLNSVDEDALRLFNSSIGEVRTALKSLEGPYIAKQVQNGETIYRFKHPTIRDGFGTYIAGDPNLMDCYLRGCTTNMLLEEISCGESGFKGGGLAIPSDRYSIVIARLVSLISETEGKEKVVEFLNSRCANDFLSAFTKAQPNFVLALKFQYWLTWCPVAQLFGRLHAAGVLPEKQRNRFVEEARKRLLRSSQWRFMLKQEMRSLLSHRQQGEFRKQARQMLSARHIRESIQIWKEAWLRSGEGTSEEYFYGLKAELAALGLEFRNNRAVRSRFRNAVDRIEALTTKLDAAQAKISDGLEADRTEESMNEGRSIFDDVDA